MVQDSAGKHHIDRSKLDLSTVESTKEALAELLPCPFCGGSDFRIQENGKMWMGMYYSDPVSVSVWHSCKPIKGQPSRQIERIGKDWESVVDHWNMRYVAKSS